MITVYAVDAQSCLMHASQAPGKGYRDVVVALNITAGVGEVLRWVTTLDPSKDNPTFGTEGTGTWEAIPDYRKTQLYLTTDGSPYTVGSTVNAQTYDGLGALPAWLTNRAKPGPTYIWQSGAWTVDLALTQASQSAMVTAACAAAVTAGQTSSALGSTYTYPTDVIGQINLQGAYSLSQVSTNPTDWTIGLTCQDSKGVWAMRQHTAAQTQKAAQDVAAAIYALRQKNATLQTEIYSSTATIASVEAVTW